MALIKLADVPNENPVVQKMFNQLDKAFGDVGNQFRLAAVSPTALKEVLSRAAYLVLDSGIRPIVFPVIRYIVATKEEGKVCINFNAAMLSKESVSDMQLQGLVDGEYDGVLTSEEGLLVEKAIKAVYAPDEFSSKDIDELKDKGFSESQILDAVEHAAHMIKMSRIFKAFKV